MPSTSWADIVRAGPLQFAPPLPPLDTSLAWPIKLDGSRGPNPGPQTRFLESKAYEILYGGAAGGGKTDALLIRPLRQMHHPKCSALFLRDTFPELQQAMDRAHERFPQYGAVWNQQEKRWEFPSGGRFEFGYCNSYKDVLQYQGDDFTDISWDELGKIPEQRIWTWLHTRLRTTAPDLELSACGSANPGGAGEAWLNKRFITKCLPDGTPIDFIHEETGINLTRAFFAAKLADNPALNTDGRYRATLSQQGETVRRQLLDGDWTVGSGLALSELNEPVHLVPAFTAPPSWYHWGAFDWGFRHPFSFGHFAADPEGNVVLVQSIKGRGLLPHEIAERILETFPVAQLRKIAAGRDCWNEQRARGENTPTIAEQFLAEGVRLTPANVSRVTGLNNLRRYLTYDHADPLRGPPRFTIMDTPANRVVYETLEGMVVDPDNPEDALKRDADDHGEGGDDDYDQVRYGLAARPLVGKAPPVKDEFSAFSPEALEAELKRTHTMAGRRAAAKKIRKLTPDNFGL